MRAVRKFVEDQLQQILAERHSLGTEQTPTGHQQHLKAKFLFLLLFLNLLSHFCFLRTIRLKQENFYRNNNTNYTRRHKFITHKNNCCQVSSRSRNEQPMFVNEYKFKEGWQSSSLKTCFLDFAEQNVNIFSANPNHTPRLLMNMLVLTLGEL